MEIRIHTRNKVWTSSVARCTTTGNVDDGYGLDDAVLNDRTETQSAGCRVAVYEVVAGDQNINRQSRPRIEDRPYLPVSEYRLCDAARTRSEFLPGPIRD